MDIAINILTVIVIEDIQFNWDVVLLITNTRGIRKKNLLETPGTKSQDQQEIRSHNC